MVNLLASIKTVAGVAIVFNAATATALGLIVTTVISGFVRVIVVKGKFRAQAADVLVDTVLHERLVKEQFRQENSDLRNALAALVQVVDFNDFASAAAPDRLHKAALAGRRALARKSELSLETDDLVRKAEKDPK
jgi:hypothetical protein